MTRFARNSIIEVRIDSAREGSIGIFVVEVNRRAEFLRIEDALEYASRIEAAFPINDREWPADPL